MMRAMITLWISIVRSCAALFRSRQDQAIVEIALRQQTAQTEQLPDPLLRGSVGAVLRDQEVHVVTARLVQAGAWQPAVEQEKNPLGAGHGHTHFGAGKQVAVQPLHRDLRIGYLFDETPQPPEGMSPMLADGDRDAYTGGLSYHTDRFRFDIAYEHVELETRSTGGMSGDAFDGTYEGHSPLLHMSITLKF